uniref:hypothetical protein n=1 Tax=Polynucleobacter sp. TaxID=2029855 RepID=UPI003F6A056D
FGACAGVEPMDFDKAWKTDLQCQIEYLSATKTRIKMGKINVAGTNIEFPLGREIDLDLSASGDRESGVSEAASTLYYIYCDKNFKLRYSDVCPRPKGKKQGYYHPKYYWRCIGTVYNDGSSNIVPFFLNQNTYYYAQNGTGSADISTVAAATTMLSYASITNAYALYQFAVPPIADDALFCIQSLVAADWAVFQKMRFNTYGTIIQRMNLNGIYSFNRLNARHENSTMTLKGASSNYSAIFIEGFSVNF